jgi:hypothetical protein
VDVDGRGDGMPRACKRLNIVCSRRERAEEEEEAAVEVYVQGRRLRTSKVKQRVAMHCGDVCGHHHGLFTSGRRARARCLGHPGQ